jgi:hypothetical protein
VAEIGVLAGATVAGESAADAAVGALVGKEAARVAATPEATSVWKREESGVGSAVKVLQARRVTVRRMKGRRRVMEVFYIGRERKKFCRIRPFDFAAERHCRCAQGAC